MSVRIYKKKPFNPPNSVRVDELSLELDRLDASRTDLINIRTKIVNGELTGKLYDFLNMDGSMEGLFEGLPRPVEDIACEELADNQLMILDSAIEGINEKMKEVMKALWESFKEWFLDWWDVNRQVRFYLQRKAAMFEAGSSASRESVEKFEKTVCNTFIKSEWEVLLKSCEAQNELVKAIPDKELPKWFNANKEAIEKALVPFGQKLVVPGPRIIQGNTVYEVHKMPLRTAGWRYQTMGTDLRRVIPVLASETEFRAQFGKMERVFKVATEADAAAIRLARQLVIKSKANIYTVARVAKRLADIAIPTK